jgi:hypothetical protein
MSGIETSVTTYRFTLPGSSEPGIGAAAPVECEVRVMQGGDIEIVIGANFRPAPAVVLSLAQFNQLRAKTFEVTGKVV